MDSRQQRVVELSAGVRTDPTNIPLRLELAEALREIGRVADSVALCHGVAVYYAGASRFAQAIAVCRGILDNEPKHRPTLQLLELIASGRAGARKPSRPTPAWMNVADAGAVSADAPPLEPAPPVGAAASSDFDDLDDASTTTMSPSREFDDLDEARTTAMSPSEIAVLEHAAAPPAVRFESTRPDIAGPSSLATDDTGDANYGEFSPEDSKVVARALRTPWPIPDASAPPAFPLLSELPRSAFLDLVTKLEVRTERAGAVIVREGEPGDAFFLVASGSVRVVKDSTVVARLSVGAFFGEFALLADQRRHASVEAETDVELLEVSRDLLDELTNAHPGVARTLRRFYGERLMETLTATAPFFAPLDARERSEVAARFRPRRFGRGARIIEQGQQGGGLFLLLIGEVEIVTARDDVEARLGVLGEGCYFGEMSLLSGGTASATVRALKTVEAVQLPPRDFYEVVSAHPVLWDTLRDEATRRGLTNHAILAGEARSGGDGSIYLV